MRPIFESDSFYDELMRFKTIKNDASLQMLLRETLEDGPSTPPFLWQMKGNQVLPSIQNAIDSIGGDVEYYVVYSNFTADQVISSEFGEHIYGNEDDASADESIGIVIFNDLTNADPSILALLFNLIDMDDFCLGKNWRIVVTGNIDSADNIWQSEFLTLFNNIEYAPQTARDYDMNESLIESMITEEISKAIRKHLGTRNRMYEGLYKSVDLISADSATDKVYTILYKGVEDGSIAPYEYIWVDKYGIEIDTKDNFDDDILYGIRRVSDFVDFDALYDDNQVIIYRDQLYDFVSENIEK